MAITLPQAIFAYQVRKTARDLGVIGTVAGIAFTYLQTRKPKLGLAVGLGLIGYFMYQRWLEEQAAGAGSTGSEQGEATAAQSAAPTPMAQEARPAMV